MKTKFRRVAAALISLFVLASCAFTPHNVVLNPTTATSNSQVGKGTKLFFRFADERDDTTVGHRSVSTIGAKVSATSLPTIVESRLRDGLIAKGYELVDSEDTADAKVTFRLRAFQFYIEQGFWSGGQNANAVLAADARRGEKDFTNVYRYSNEKRIQVIPDGGGIDTQMNSVLSEVLNKALADTSLDAFLTGKPAP